MLVVGCGTVAKIFKLDKGKWTAIETITGHTESIRDVAWADSLARLFS
jgi:hypothetical protein